MLPSRCRTSYGKYPSSDNGADPKCNQTPWTECALQTRAFGLCVFY